MSNDLETFASVKQSQPSKQVDRAVRMIYLNRTAFGGLYRENQRGEFNVPFGHYTDRTLCQEDRLRAASKALRHAEIHCQCFSAIAERPVEGDFVYLDPPYISGHQQNGFVRYNRHLFTWERQQELAILARDLDARGVHVLVSNSDHDAIRSLYAGFSIYSTNRLSQFSTDPARHGSAAELLISNFSLQD